MLNSVSWSGQVDWYPWGEEAFKKAREENKPIFCSVSAHRLVGSGSASDGPCGISCMSLLVWVRWGTRRATGAW